jgi:hypothetical protein
LFAYAPVGSDSVEVGDVKPVLGGGELQLLEVVDGGVDGESLDPTWKLLPGVVFGESGGPAEGLPVDRVEYSVPTLADPQH